MARMVEKIKVAAVTLFLVLFIIASTGAVKAYRVDSQGNVIFSRFHGFVLSAEDDSGDASDNSGKRIDDDKDGLEDLNEEEPELEDRDRDEDRSGSSDGEDDDLKKEFETVTSDGTIVKTKVEDDGRIKTETIFPSGIRVKTKEGEDRVRTDIYQNGYKLRLERRDGRLMVKLESEDGEEVELPEGLSDELLKIEEREDKNQIKVNISGNKFLVSRGEVGAETPFPVSVDLGTNELTILTPSGEKTVAMLPDTAVSSMLSANIIDQVRGLAFTQDVQTVATSSATTLQEVINLTSTGEGVLAYEIPGVSNQKFLGFIPVAIEKTAVVSAETGELLDVSQTLGSTVLDIFSF